MKSLVYFRSLFGARIGLTTVAILLSIVLIAGIWTAITVSVSVKRTNALHAAAVNMENLSRAYERDIVLSLRSIDQVAKIVKAEYESTNGNFDLPTFLRRILVPANEILLIAIANEKGDVIASSSRDFPKNVNLSDRNHFKVHQTNLLNDLYISRPLVGRVSKKESVSMTRRIEHTDGSFAGIVVVSVDPTNLTNFYSEPEFGRSGAVALLGRDGEYRALRIGDSTRNSGQLNIQDVMRTVPEANQMGRPLAIASIDDKSRFYAVRQVEGYPLFTVVGFPESDVLGPVIKEADTIYGWGAVGTAGILFFVGIGALLAMRMRALNNDRTEDFLVRSKTEKALLISEDRFKHMTELSSDWYWEQDDAFRFTVASRDAVGDLAQLQSNYLGKTRWEIPMIVPCTVWTSHKEDLAAHRSFVDFEYKVLFTASDTDKDIAPRWFSINGEPLFNEAGVFIGYCGTGKDITERVESEARMRHMAMHDVLTNLPNRTLLRDRLRQVIARAERHGHEVWVLFIDLDRFKSVNDSLGHKAGDDLLKIVAERLQKTARDNDTVARLGSDEFVMVLSDFPAGTVSTRIVARIREAIAEPIALEGQQVVISCSIGAAVYPNDGTDIEKLIEQADAAMYFVKKNGRDNFQLYASTMNERASERFEIEAGLRRALINGEFVLHYQPQVDLQTNQIVGVEALIRWMHPQQGMISPLRFINVAEETGLIVPMGLWVLQTACAQNKAWQDAGYPALRMAVNLSARQFAHPELLQNIIDTLDDTGLQPRYLDIEITESLLVTDVEQAVGLMHQIDRLGVSLSIDDFGTGYSSLTYLKRFPVDVLKIDQSFIKDIALDRTGEAIIVSIISLAHNLGIQVIAEGVEELAHLKFLQKHRCDQMQGYYFSKPVAAPAFEQILKAGKTLSTAQELVTVL